MNQKIIYINKNIILLYNIGSIYHHKPNVISLSFSYIEHYKGKLSISYLYKDSPEEIFIIGGYIEGGYGYNKSTVLAPFPGRDKNLVKTVSLYNLKYENKFQINSKYL